jgi:YVTN family beta-propeller protein
MLSFRRTILATLLALAVAAPAMAASKVLVVSRKENCVQVFDAKSLDSLNVIPVKTGPHELVLSPDGRYAYVANYKSRDALISVIDINAGKTIHEISTTPYTGVHSVDISSDGKMLYVTAEQRRCVVEVDLAQQKVSRVFKTLMQITHTCILSPDDKTLIAANTRDGNVTMFDLTTGELDRHLLTGRGVEGMSFTPDGRFLWTANAQENTISVVDMTEKRRIKKVARRGYPLRILLTPDGKEAWATLSTFGKVAVYDVATMEELGEFRVGNVPIGIAMDPEGAYVYVTNKDDDTVVKIDRAERTVVATGDTPDTPDGVAVVP